MDTKISTFQPIGDAADELRAVVAGLDHTGALNVLQHSETVGESWVHGHRVTFKTYEGWTVVAPPTEITAGTRFDTDFETGCVALESPDEDGNFDALDHERVTCSFTVTMVRGHACYVPQPANRASVKKALATWKRSQAL
jgi:hypothetical protein